MVIKTFFRVCNNTKPGFGQYASDLLDLFVFEVCPKLKLHRWRRTTHCLYTLQGKNETPLVQSMNRSEVATTQERLRADMENLWTSAEQLKWTVEENLGFAEANPLLVDLLEDSRVYHQLGKPLEKVSYQRDSSHTIVRER